MNFRLSAANTNDISSDSSIASSRSPRLLAWLAKLTRPDFSIDLLAEPLEIQEKPLSPSFKPHSDDWNIVSHLCGHSMEDFEAANSSLPLTAAEIDYFRRNHRGTENHISRDFLTAQTDLPSPLAELYGLYRHRTRIDTEAALWLAQSTGSLRVSKIMADLLAIGGFANGLEYVSYLGVTYSVPCAFDTSAEIDAANRESLRRLSLPIDHPSHLLKLKPDELGVLAASIAGNNALEPEAFLEKANLLCEARQDVNRLPISQQFTTAVEEHDLPISEPWAQRLIKAYARYFGKWMASVSDIQGILN